MAAFVGAAVLTIGSVGHAQTPPKPPSSKPATNNSSHSTKANPATAYEMAPKQAGLVKLKRGPQATSIALKKNGAVVPEALEALSQALKHKSGATHAVDPRFAELLVTVSDHFGGRAIEVMGGYRPPPGHSNHNLGKAIDLRVEGVPIEAVRDYCQTLDHAGVGYYPGGKFVHLDWRNRAKQWTDDTPLAPTAKAGGGAKGSSHTPQAPPQPSNKTGGNPHPQVSP